MDSIHPYIIALTGSSYLITKTERYELLRKCMNMDISITALEAMIPDITFEELIELSLFFNPIEISKKLYNQTSLFFNACFRHNSLKAIDFIYDYSEQPLLRVAWIAYRTNRIDIFKSLLDSGKVPAESETFYFRELYNMLCALRGEKYEIMNQKSDLFFDLGPMIYLLDPNFRDGENLRRLVEISYRVNEYSNPMRDRWKEHTSLDFQSSISHFESISKVYEGHPHSKIILEIIAGIQLIRLTGYDWLKEDQKNIGIFYLAYGDMIRYVHWKRLRYPLPESIDINKLIPGPTCEYACTHDTSHLFGRTISPPKISVIDAIRKAELTTKKESPSFQGLLDMFDVFASLMK